MSKSKKRSVQADHDDFQQRSKRQHSGEARSHRMSSEEEYTTDDLSSEEDQHQHQHQPPARAAPAAPTSRKSTSKPRRWQPHEDKLLTAAVNQCGEANWKSIASKVGSRNHVQCLQRWKKVLRPGLVKGQWDAEEDAALMRLATAPFKNWGTLSTQMTGRTSKQCRERWCHHLNPDINKGPYTRQEDETILKVHEKLGNKWSLIAAKLPGRTENSIKIRCKALQRKNGGARATSRGGVGSGKSTANSPVKSPRSAKKSAGASATAPPPASSSSTASASSPPSLQSPSGAGGGMVADQPPVSGRPESPGPGLAPGSPQQHPRSSSRGLQFDPLSMGPSEAPLLPAAAAAAAAAAPAHGGGLPETGNRYGKLAAKAEPLEWPPSGDLRNAEMFSIGGVNQQQRYQPVPSLGQHNSYGVRSAFFGGVGGGSSNGGSGEGMFDHVLTPTGASYFGHPRQPPLGHFASEFGSPPLPQVSASAARGQGPEEIYPDQRQACLVDNDDELEAEALAAVGAEDIPSAGTTAGNMAALASNIATLEEISATIRAATTGQDAGGGGGDGGGGQPGDDLKRDADDRDESAEEGNGPLRSCCSFLALNAQDNIVGDADSWQEGKDGGDDGGALMID